MCFRKTLNVLGAFVPYERFIYTTQCFFTDKHIFLQNLLVKLTNLLKLWNKVSKLLDDNFFPTAVLELSQTTLFINNY